MTDVILFWIALLCGVILTYACYLAQGNLSIRKTRRPALAFEVVFAFVFAIVAICVWLWMLADWPQNDWPLRYRRLFVISWPGLLSLLYLLVSWPIRALGRKLFSIEDLQPYFTLGFYVQRKDENGLPAWYLKRNLQGLAFVFTWTCRILLGAALFLCLAAAYDSSEWTLLDPLVPICILFPVHAMTLYLKGSIDPLKKEEETPAAAKPDQSGTYRRAADALEEAFGEALLFKQRPHKVPERPSQPSLLEAFEQSPNVADQMVSTYFRSEYPDEPLDPDYLRAASRLLEHKNTIIYNPFYRDLGKYLAMPLHDSLMAHHSILVLVEGNEEVQRIIDWLGEVFDRHARFVQKWKIRAIDDLIPDCDVGVLSYSKLYEPSVLRKNRAFFEKTEYILLLEPSASLCDIQAGLGVLSSFLARGRKPVYCVLDQSMNGLKDTLGHVLRTGFDFECAQSVQASSQTFMIWDAMADFHSIERFHRETSWLGGGIEIGAVAAGAGVPAVEWCAQTSLPLYDVQNLAAASAETVCSVMNIYPSQTALKERLRVEPSFYNDGRKPESFLIVEDELHNPFAMLKTFRTRAGRDLFLNILSEDYLLRDYFCANAQMFLTNPHSIRSLVGAYAKTPRNLMISLLLQMNTEPMRLEELEKELSIGSLESPDPIAMLVSLLKAYTQADEDLLVIEKRRIQQAGRRPDVITTIGIDPDRFAACFGRTLKNVSYVLEDEQRNRHFLKARLYSLIPQTLLPGQHMTFEGRNYAVAAISAANGVVLRRASDQSVGRRSVRQRRTYTFAPFDQSRSIRATHINGVGFLWQEASFTVVTESFEERIVHSGLSKTMEHRFSSPEVIEELKRSYRNKSILRIMLPQLAQSERILLAALMQELFATVLPEGMHYLALLVSTAQSGSQEKQVQNPSLYYHSDAVPEGEMWIVEDSEMDLGLLETCEKYFFTFLEILQDFLRWRLETNASAHAKNKETEDGSSVRPSSWFEYEGVLEKEEEPKDRIPNRKTG